MIEILSVRREPLNAMVGMAWDVDDCAKEGFPELSPAGFVSMFCCRNRAKKCRPDTIVTRIEFKHVPEESATP